MIKKIFLIALALSVAAIMTTGLHSLAKRTSEAKSNIHSLSVLTDAVIDRIGDNPTFESFKSAQQALDRNKAAVRAKLKSVEQADDFRKDSEIAFELETCKTENLNKIADVYNHLLGKVDEDVEAMNRLREEKDRLRISNLSTREVDKRIKKQLSVIQENNKLLDAMAVLVSSYKSIFEEERKEEK